MSSEGLKVAILAGGRGTRFAEETAERPKPLIEIGSRPILWHIMRYYAGFGHNHFVLALGYKGECIKRWFSELHTRGTNLTIDALTGEMTVHDNHRWDWTIDLVETGLGTKTGGRIKRLRSWIGDETFMVTHADGLADVDLDALLAFHRSHGRLATVTAVHPPPRFGILDIDDDRVTRFTEKPRAADTWINGAYFVFEPGVFDYIGGDETMLEEEPLENLAADGELMAFRHQSFWQCMDTVHDRQMLERLWEDGTAPWLPAEGPAADPAGDLTDRGRHDERRPLIAHERPGRRSSEAA